jgi:O-antigen/teichoic acid export membrane protein
MTTSNQGNHPLKNSLYSLIGYIFPIIFFILITPVLVARLGLEHYGTYILINTVVLFVALLDFGVSSAFIKYISEARAHDDQGKISKLSATANLIFLLVGLLGFGIVAVVGLLFSSTASNPEYFRLCFVLAGISFIFTSFVIPFQLTPRACLNFNYEVVIGIIQITIFNLGALILAWRGYGLKEILILQILINLVFLAIYSLTAKKLLSNIKLFPAWHQSTGKLLFGYGLKTFIGNIASMITSQLDRLIIPIFLGASALPYYALPGNITTQTGGITNALTSVLFPLASKLQTETQEEKIATIYLRAFRLICVIATAITLAIIIFRQKLLYFWLGGDFSERSATIMLVLGIVGFVMALTRPAASVLLGLGHNKFLAIVSCVTAGINLILLLILIPIFGLIGSAYAFLIAVIPYLFYLWYLEVKVLKLSEFYLRQFKLFLKIIAVALIFWPLCEMVLLPHTNRIISLVIIGPSSIVIYLGIYWLLGFFDAEDITTIKKFISSYRKA